MLNWFSKKIQQSIRAYKKKHLKKQIYKQLTYHKHPLLLLFGTLGTFFTVTFSKLMILKPDGLYIGQPNAWGDWAVHISITNLFAHKPISEWFLYHPFFASGKLTYGFLVHLITALIMKLGFSLQNAFFFISIVLFFSFLLGLYALYFQLSKSKSASILGIFLFFTSSGMGIFRYWKELSWKAILTPTQDYSRFVEYEWLAGNIPAAMLIPQRAFFIGVTIGVWVLNLLLWGVQAKKKKERNTAQKLFFIAGVLAGILPIAHMHSFIVICIVTGSICWFNRAKFRPLLLYFVLPAGILASLLYFSFIHGGIEISPFMTTALGWTAPRTHSLFQNSFNWIQMWLKLWGTFLPAALFAFILFYKKLTKQTNRAFFFGFIGVFLLANYIVLQPTKWDNTKLFAWVYLGLCILIAQLSIKLWHTATLHKILSVILIISLCATGTVELLRIANFSQNTHMLSSTSEIQFATEIAQHTTTDAVFLTSTAHNHPIPLWANRPIFLGYLGWIRNFGFDSTIREQHLEQIFAGSPQANQLLKENTISYIFVGPKERNSLEINHDYLKQFPVAFQNEDSIVYDTRQLWQ